MKEKKKKDTEALQNTSGVTALEKAKLMCEEGLTRMKDNGSPASSLKTTRTVTATKIGTNRIILESGS